MIANNNNNISSIVREDKKIKIYISLKNVELLEE